MFPSEKTHLLLLIFIFIILPFTISSTSYTDLVFKGCADQKFQNFQQLYKPTLEAIFTTLTTQSITTKFYKTGPGASITGSFQCRGDLSNKDCQSCVKSANDLSIKICKEAIATRIQLKGCLVKYEIAGFKQAAGSDMLYKVCGSGRADGSGFSTRLDSAMGEIVKGVGSNGFYAGVFEGVYVMGQCEGDLVNGECVDCVKKAVDDAKSECGSSISGGIYLEECYVSYAYYPNGVPAAQSQAGISAEKEKGSEGPGMHPQKTVALVLGGLVGVGLVMACLLFAKSAFKKKTYTYKYGG